MNYMAIKTKEQAEAENFALLSSWAVPPAWAVSPDQNNPELSTIDFMWRVAELTRHFGPAGEGWKCDLVEENTFTVFDPDANRECLVAEATVNLFYRLTDGGWSEPLVGKGAAFFERSPLSARKAAYSDAFGNACKWLGMAAKVYSDRLPVERKPRNGSPAEPSRESKPAEAPHKSKPAEAPRENKPAEAPRENKPAEAPRENSPIAKPASDASQVKDTGTALSGNMTLAEALKVQIQDSHGAQTTMEQLSLRERGKLNYIANRAKVGGQYSKGQIMAARIILAAQDKRSV